MTSLRKITILSEYQNLIRASFDLGVPFAPGESVFQSADLRAQLKNPTDVASASQVTAVKGYCEGGGDDQKLCALQKVIAQKAQLADLARNCIVARTSVNSNQQVSDAEVNKGLGLAHTLWGSLFNPVKAALESGNIASAERMLDAAIQSVAPESCAATLAKQ